MAVSTDAAAGATFPGGTVSGCRESGDDAGCRAPASAEDLALNWKSRLPPRSSLAMVVVDHTSMKVRGWVGSADISDDSRFGHIEWVSAIRSPVQS